MNKLKVFALFTAAAFLISFLISIYLGEPFFVNSDFILKLRLPRVLLAACTGASLAVAGLVLQLLFFNSLCEPYTLGISSGGAFGAVLASALGFSLVLQGIAGGAFLGALLFTVILYLLSLNKKISVTSLLLSGVTLGFLGSSLVAVCMILFDPNGIQGALIWLLGDLSRARLAGVWAVCAMTVSLICLIYSKRKELDSLLLGEEVSLSLGFNPSQIRSQLILYTSLLVGLSVSSAGMIGFVGLVVPHFMRMVLGSSHSRLIPFAALWGGIVLVLSDIVSRTLYPPYEIPVGVISALVGAPLFFYLMMRKERVS